MTSWAFVSIFLFLVGGFVSHLEVEGLRCYVCSSLRRRPDTCNDQDRRIASAEKGDVWCRTSYKGNQVVGQGLVSGSLCTQKAIETVKIKLLTSFRGTGLPDVKCCNTDLCNVDNSPPAGRSGNNNDDIPIVFPEDDKSTSTTKRTTTSPRTTRETTSPPLIDEFSPGGQSESGRASSSTTTTEIVAATERVTQEEPGINKTADEEDNDTETEQDQDQGQGEAGISTTTTVAPDQNEFTTEKNGRDQYDLEYDDPNAIDRSDQGPTVFPDYSGGKESDSGEEAGNDEKAQETTTPGEDRDQKTTTTTSRTDVFTVPNLPDYDYSSSISPSTEAEEEAVTLIEELGIEGRQNSSETNQSDWTFRSSLNEFDDSDHSEQNTEEDGQTAALLNEGYNGADSLSMTFGTFLTSLTLYVITLLYNKL